MKRILQITGSLNIGGVEKIVVDWYKNIDHTSYQFDFVTFDCTEGFYEAEVKKYGAEVFRIAPPRHGYFHFINDVKKTLTKKKYDAIHCHTLFNSGFFVQYAAKASIPIRITHSHTTVSRVNLKFYNRLYQNYMQSKILRFSTKITACSQEAGEYLFTKNIFKTNGSIIPNGIEAEKYTFDEAIRNQIRTLYHISSETILLGMIGRFHTVKNIPFALNLLKNLNNNNEKKYKLLLVGDGPDAKSIQSLTQKLKLENTVIFAGFQNNTIPYYQAIDIFLMPSLFEGFGLAAIEAQAAGCLCILSNQIPIVIKTTPATLFLPINDSQQWIEQIQSTSVTRYPNTVIDSQFNISFIISKLTNLYSSLF